MKPYKPPGYEINFIENVLDIVIAERDFELLKRFLKACEYEIGEYKNILFHKNIFQVNK